MSQIEGNVTQPRGLAIRKRWLELLLAGSILTFTWMAMTSWPSRLLNLPIDLGRGAIFLIDVRNWHWAWYARSTALHSLHSVVGWLDFREWSWITYAVVFAISIVGLVSYKAWQDSD